MNCGIPMRPEHEEANANMELNKPGELLRRKMEEAEREAKRRRAIVCVTAERESASHVYDAGDRITICVRDDQGYPGFNAEESAAQQAVQQLMVRGIFWSRKWSFNVTRHPDPTIPRSDA